MKALNVMIKPASSLCDLRCRYCFYSEEAESRCVRSYGVMTEDRAERIVENVFSDLGAGDRVQFIFQGGEPTLAGLNFFESFTALVGERQGIGVSWALQTNGLSLDDAWCEFLKVHGFLVGLSLDLLPDAHDASRVDAAGRGSYRRVLDALSLLRRHGVEYNVLCTLTGEVARHPDAVWRQVTSLGIDYVQFTPCLGPLDGTRSPYALTPERFASFYTRLFALWYADFQAGRRRSVKLFDDIVNLLILGTPTACGMDGRCRGQLVIEANGDAYPCDFYCLDEWRLGNAAEEPPSRLLENDAMQRFLSRNKDTVSCSGCRYARFCGGGCPRMEREVYAARDGVCGFQKFMDACGGELFTLAKRARENYLQKHFQGGNR